MADEKLNVSPEENPQPSLFDAGPEGAPAQDAPAPEPPAPENAPEQTGGEPPAQDAPAGAPGEVSVSADQIEKLMAERRAAERAEVEKNEPPEPEQPPTPEDKAAGEKEPGKKGKAAKEKTPEPDKPKGRRGRKPKEEKAGPGEPGGTGARRGRPAKADKAAPDRPPSQPRDKMSQSKGGKIAFNLTKRQLVCFGGAALVGVPSYLLARSSFGNTAALFLMLGIMLPAFLLAMYEKDGLPLEKVVKNIIRAKYLRPGVRPYKTGNIYAPFTGQDGAGKEAVNGKPNKQAKK